MNRRSLFVERCAHILLMQTEMLRPTAAASHYKHRTLISIFVLEFKLLMRVLLLLPTRVNMM